MGDQETINPPNNRPNKMKGFLIILGIVAMLALFSVLIDDKPASLPNDSHQIKSAPEAILEMRAEWLRMEYEDNEIAADQKYKDKIIIVTGPIESIGKDIAGQAYVVVAEANKVFSVQCMFDKSQVNAVAQLGKGQNVRIKGKVSGKMMHVIMRDCRLP